MRVTGGIGKGRKLKVPAGSRVRPTSDKVKQALFNILGEKVKDAVFLDLYAGTGGIGIEALSRGARKVVFIDDSRESLQAVRRNVEQTGFAERSQIVPARAEAFLRKTSEKFDLVFLDPPYTLELAPLLTLVSDSAVLNQDAIVVTEHFKKQASAEHAGNLSLHRESQYGDTVLAFYKKQEPGVRSQEPGARRKGQAMKHIAVYPGTFDPVTNGHIDLVERSLRIFDEVIIAIAENPKKTPLFSLDERLTMFNKVTANYNSIVIEGFDGLLVEYMRKKKAVAIIRGLRAISDFEYEMQMALMNRRLDNTIETVFMMPNEAYSFITSTIVKEAASYGGDVSSLVPQFVVEKLKNKFAK